MKKYLYLKTLDTATYTTNGFQIPLQYSGSSSASQQFTITNPGLQYTLTGDAATLSTTGGVTSVFLNNVQLSNNDLFYLDQY